MSLKFNVILSPRAKFEMEKISKNLSKKAIAKTVVKTLRFMKENLKHPSLRTHKFDNMKGSNGEEVFESYAQNHTPGAYRIFWFYGPDKSMITILAITPHP